MGVVFCQRKVCGASEERGQDEKPESVASSEKNAVILNAAFGGFATKAK